MNNKQLHLILAAAGRHRIQALQEWEQRIHSFVDICDQSNNVDAAYDDHGGLAGITVGVKDIIDVKGMPTRNGSAVCRHAEPAVADAAVVAALRNAGAHIIGKTTTTEFAFTDPTNCRNPYDLRRSPGGSSSGSGAAVAAGLVDMALGTQTAGSLCRPAAYCGVVGFKPSYGILPTTGVTPLATSFDTVGVITSSVDVARKGFMAMGGMAPSHIADEFLVASALLPTATSANVETLAGFRDASDVLQREGISVKELEICLNISEIVSAHRTVMNAEAADAHQHLLKPDCFTLVQAKFRAGLQAGIVVSASQLEDAQGVLALARTVFWRQLAGVDIVLTLPVPEGAPLMDGTTGFQDWLTPWTVFGGPLICLPWGLDSLGRPASVMLAAHPGEDGKLLAMAKRLEPLAPPMPRPQLPVA